MCRHNVVLLLLAPDALTKPHAGLTAGDIAPGFSGIKLRLVVGIAGGGPSQRHDIRLGDVVVGIAPQGMGGVVQYNVHKTVRQKMIMGDYVSTPPPVILSATKSLKKRYNREWNRIEEAVGAVLTMHPSMRETYKRPKQSSDMLFAANATHRSICTDVHVCSSDPSHLIVRPYRGEDHPAVHFGVIATARQIFRDGPLRHKTPIECDIICFDTNVAKLPKRYASLVVRGIFDYADTHINTAWQGYAAMAAAAYTKDLLGEITPA